MFEWKQGNTRMLSPKNVEEMMVAIGLKERHANIDIMMTTEVFADLCFRLVRMESMQCPCAGTDEGDDYD